LVLVQKGEPKTHGEDASDVNKDSYLKGGHGKRKVKEA